MAWGYDGNGEVSNLAHGNDFIDVASHQGAGYALRADGSIVAWGRDLYDAVSDTPTGTGFTQVSCGYYQGIALRADGTVVAWGYNHRGQGTAPSGSDYARLSAGYFHNLALKTDGSLHSWGSDEYGQVSATPAGNDFIEIAAGEHHSLALRQDGSIVAWGYDMQGQVSNTPTGTGYTDLAASLRTSVALRADGGIEAWGGDNYSVVSGVPAGNDFVQVANGTSFGLGLRNDGTIAAWGDDQSGEVAEAPTSDDFLLVECGHGWGLALSTRLSPPNLDVGVLREGLATTFTVSSCEPGDVVVAAVSLRGDGPVALPIGMVELSPPLHMLPPEIADAAGTATFATSVPMGMAGRKIWMQAVDIDRGVLSNGVLRVIQATPVPEITEVIPGSALQGQIVDLILHGSGFEVGAEIELLGTTTTIPLTDRWYLLPSLIGGRADLTSAPAGFYTARVVNLTGLEGELVDGFEVLVP